MVYNNRRTAGLPDTCSDRVGSGCPALGSEEGSEEAAFAIIRLSKTPVEY